MSNASERAGCRGDRHLPINSLEIGQPTLPPPRPRGCRPNFHTPAPVTDTDPPVVRIESNASHSQVARSKLAFECEADGIQIGRPHLGLHPVALGLNYSRLKYPNSDSNRTPASSRPTAGHVVHIDVKQVGRIPEAAGSRTQ